MNFNIGGNATFPFEIVIGLAIFIILATLLRAGYVKAAPDTALIISGMHKKPRTFIGKAGFMIPFFERKDVLRLQLIAVDVKTSNAVPTADYININVDAAVNIKISDDSTRLNLAAQNFLNKNTEYIGKVAREVLEGNMREIVGRMALEEMVSDRQKFANLVKENAEPDLAAMGLDIISFNVQNFVDGNGVIENLGVDNIVKIQKNAAISRAESEKEIAKAQAAAKQESNDAQVEAERAIAEKQNDLAIRQAELKKEADIKRAEADAAYRIQEEEQRKTIETATVNANIAKAERDIELRTREAEVQEKELDATVRRKADAEKYRRQLDAEAKLIERQKDAEAKKYEQEREAEAQKAVADAARYAKTQEAEGIAAVGEAQARAIKAQGEAEAAAMLAKADAMKQYGDAAKMEMIIKMLPEFAKAVAEPIAAIDKVTVIDSGSGESGVSSVGGYTPAVLAKVIESVKETTGFDLTEVMKANTYDAKVNHNLNVSGLATGSGKTTKEQALVSSSGQVSGPKFEGDHVHIYDADGTPVHG